MSGGLQVTVGARKASAFLVLLAGYALLVAIAFIVIFAGIAGNSLLQSLEAAAVNSIPLLILGLAAREVLERFVFDRPLKQQTILHLLLAAAFSLLLYWAILSAFALLRGQHSLGFIIRPFPRSAGVWQLLHGITVYALVAAFALIDRLYRTASGPTAVGSQSAVRKDRGERLLLKNGDEIVPVEVSEIVTITGADDYAELVMVRGRHLARMSLGQFQEELPADRFVRAHRSHLVNIDHLVRAEPAGGGRLTLHMAGGTTVMASRSGARLLRERML